MNDDVRRFIESIPADQRPLFERLCALIQNAYPDATLKLSYGVPTFKSKGGWVALGYWKGGVSIHTDGRHNIEEFNAAYPRIKTGTGTINLRVTDVVPEEALLAVIRRAMTGGGNWGWCGIVNVLARFGKRPGVRVRGEKPPGR